MSIILVGSPAVTHKTKGTDVKTKDTQILITSKTKLLNRKVLEKLVSEISV